MRRELRISVEAGISFRLDCYNHAIFALRQWPRRTFPGIIAALTGMGFQEYAITMNVFPKSVDKVIEREEQHIQRLQIDSISERKQSLVTDMLARQEKVTELQQGKVIPLNCLFAVRLWHRNTDQLAARCASLKNALISMGGAVIHHATIPENARQLFYQTWPGWTFGTYRAFDLPAEDSYLADMIPWSATFTGHLEGAEAIYNGARGNLVGIKTRLGNTPQHGVLFGMTGAGKSVIVADLLAQIGHRFGFRLIVEEGLVACRTDPDSRLRADHRESKRKSDHKLSGHLRDALVAHAPRVQCRALHAFLWKRRTRWRAEGDSSRDDCREPATAVHRCVS